MLPAVHIPPLQLWGTVLKPFWVLVTLAVLLGFKLGVRRARAMGLDPDRLWDGSLWTVGAGFVMGHLVSVIFYFPERIAESPLVLLAVWNGLSSFGGLLGAIAGSYAYYRLKRLPYGSYVEASIFGFIPAWNLGRLGCTLTFDHPGVPTTFLLGMSDKSGMPAGHWGLYWGGVVRHNLGFYELLLTLAVTAALYALKDRRPLPNFHVVLALLMYTPLRFYWDFLRVKDVTYLGLTAGQYLALAQLALALWLLWRGLRARRAGWGAPSPGGPPGGAAT